MKHLLAIVVLTIAADGALFAQTPKPVRTNERPAAPANFRATRTGHDEVTLSWDAVEGATAYAIGRLVPPAGWVNVGRVAAGTTSYVDRGRALSSTHTYNIKTIAGAMASLDVRSAQISSNAPIQTGAAAADQKMTPPGKEGTAPRSSGSDPAGCVTAGGYTTCTSAVASLYPAEAEKTTTVYCPAGLFALSGGFARDAQSAAQIKESRPTAVAGKGDRPGWVVTIQRLAMGASADIPETITNWLGLLTPVSFTAYVICAPPR